MDAQCKEQIAKYRATCDSDITKLEQLFDKDGTKWADEIFQNIIKG